MTKNLTICLSSKYSLQLNEYRNNGAKKELFMSGLGKSALLVSAAVETVSFGSLAILSTIFYPKSDRPYSYLSQKFSSAHFTVYNNIADLFLNFSSGNLATRETEAKRQFDQSTICTLAKVVIAATNAYIFVNTISLVFAVSTLATLLKITLITGYVWYVITHYFSGREFFLAAVRHNGMGLQFAIEELRADRDVVLAAIKQDERALYYAKLNPYLFLEFFLFLFLYILF